MRQICSNSKARRYHRSNCGGCTKTGSFWYTVCNLGKQRLISDGNQDRTQTRVNYSTCVARSLYSRMRILLINDYATPTGGAELMLLMLRDALRRRGHDARIFASSARPLGLPS